MKFIDSLKRFTIDRLHLYKYFPFLTHSSTTIITDNSAYSQDVIRQAISCIVTEISKTVPTHIRTVNGEDQSVAGSAIQTVLNNPNEFMTMPQFIEKIMWILLLNNNVFIYPEYNLSYDINGNVQKQLTGLYPLQPRTADILQDPSGAMYIKFNFVNGYTSILPYSSVIHVKINYSTHEVMGGNIFGKPDNTGLMETAKLNDKLLKSVADSLNSSCTVNGILKYNTMLANDKQVTAVQEFNEKLKNSESGIIPMDLKCDYVPLQKNPKLIDKETLAFIDQKLLRYYGVPLCVLEGDFTPEQHGAFYQRACEHLVINLGAEFTKKLFSDRERAFGNKIVFYPDKLMFMSNAQKIEYLKMLIDTGCVYQNELRTATGLMMAPELSGQIALSSQKHFAVNNDTEGQENAKSNTQGDQSGLQSQG